MKSLDYKIVSAKGNPDGESLVSNLENKVKTHLEGGWELLGGVSSTTLYGGEYNYCVEYSQAMTKVIKKPLFKKKK